MLVLIGVVYWGSRLFAITVCVAGDQIIAGEEGGSAKLVKSTLPSRMNVHVYIYLPTYLPVSNLNNKHKSMRDIVITVEINIHN